MQPRFPVANGRPAVINADLTPEVFALEWRKVSLWLRWLIYGLAPLMGLHRRWFSSRAKLAKDMSCEDQPSLKELLTMTPETGALTQAILGARDDSLLHVLDAELDLDPRRPKAIAIIYGAAHMRAVVRLLTKRNFFIASTEWRTIFSAS